jgi:glycosyltransferase involved in cell wall biosynthesis
MPDQESGSGSSSSDVHRDLVPFPVVPRPTSAANAARAERATAAAFDRHVADFRPDVVSWWRLGELSMSLPGRARAAGLPAVGMVCDPWMRDGPARDPWAQLNGSGPDLSAARWLWVSRALRDLLGGRGDVVTAGIELDDFPEAAPHPWRGRLLCIGRLSPLKGVDTAVSAVAHLPSPTRLDVVGDGAPEYRFELRARAAALGVAGRVAFAPARPPAAVSGSYAAADAVLFPVRWAEPWGLVPLEAMAVGRPVVATGMGGSAEYLRHEHNALLVAPDDPPALAAAVARLAADPELRAHLRRGGRATAEAHPAQASHASIRRALEAAAAGRRQTEVCRPRSRRPARSGVPSV